MSTEPKPAEDAVALKAPTVDDETAPVKKISESKVSLKMLMPSLSVQCHIRTPLTVGRVPHPRVAQSKHALPNPLPC